MYEHTNGHNTRNDGQKRVQHEQNERDNGQYARKNGQKARINGQKARNNGQKVHKMGPGGAPRADAVRINCFLVCLEPVGARKAVWG